MNCCRHWGHKYMRITIVSMATKAEANIDNRYEKVLRMITGRSAKDEVW